MSSYVLSVKEREMIQEKLDEIAVYLRKQGMKAPEIRRLITEFVSLNI